MPNRPSERYLIVGGGGYLGAVLIAKLQKSGHRGTIVVLDPRPQKFNSIKIKRNRVNYRKGDFQDEQVLRRALKNVKAVFHLASIGHTGLVADDREAVFKFNVEGTQKLVELSRVAGVKRFHYASSVAVAFVGKELTNAQESDALPDPKEYLDHYSASKAVAERFVLEQSDEGFKTSCLRFRNIYGPEDPNVTRKVADLTERGLFKAMVSKYDREAESNGSSATNCAKAFALAEREMKKKGGYHGQVYYITDEEKIGQYTFWKDLVESRGETMPVVIIPYKWMTFIVPVINVICYRWLGITPLMTDFELAIVSTDNTYSCKKARDQLGYYPEPNDMKNVAEFYNRTRPVSPRQGRTWKTAISISFVILLVSFFLAYFYYF